MNKTYKTKVSIELTVEDYNHYVARKAITGESQATIFRRGLNSEFPKKGEVRKNGN